MKLSNIERIILIQQAEILKTLSAQRGEQHAVKDYQNAQHALISGYEYVYHEFLPHLSNPMPDSVANDVIDTLCMYDAIGVTLPTEDLVPEELRHVWKFSGYDGNYEGVEYGFCRFFVNQMERFQNFEIRNFNSHCPMVATYDRMLAKWRDQDDKHQMTREQAIEVLQAGKLRRAA